jgi:hypothetical protein
MNRLISKLDPDHARPLDPCWSPDFFHIIYIQQVLVDSLLENWVSFRMSWSLDLWLSFFPARRRVLRNETYAQRKHLPSNENPRLCLDFGWEDDRLFISPRVVSIVKSTSLSAVCFHFGWS